MARGGIWLIALASALRVSAHGESALSKSDQSLLWIMLNNRIFVQHQFSWQRIDTGGQLSVRSFDHVIVVRTGAGKAVSQLLPSWSRACLGLSGDIRADFLATVPQKPESVAEKVTKEALEEIAEQIAEKLGKWERRTIETMQVASFALELLKLYSDDQLRLSAQRIDAYLNTDAGLQAVFPVLKHFEERVRDVDPAVVELLNDMTAHPMYIPAGQDGQRDQPPTVEEGRLIHYGRPGCF